MTQPAPILRALRIASFASWVLCTLPVLSASPKSATVPAARDSELQSLLGEGERLLRSGDFKSAREPLEKAVSLSEQRGDSPSLARALNLLGSALRYLGDSPRSLSLLKRSLQLYRTLGKLEEQAKVLNNLAGALQNVGDYQEALKSLQQALSVERRLGSPGPQGWTLSNIGVVYASLSRYAEARDYLLRALSLRRKTGVPREIGATLDALGVVSKARGEYDQALRFLRESLEWRLKAGDRGGEQQTLGNLGALYGELGQNEISIWYFGQALAIAQDIGYAHGVGLANSNLGRHFEILGRWEEARARFDAALALFRQINRRNDVATALIRIGTFHLESNRDLEKARAAHLEALEISRAIQDRRTQGRALDGLARVALAKRSANEALSMLDQALDQGSSLGPDLEYMVRADRARVLLALGREEEALSQFQASARIVNNLRANLKSDPEKVGFLDLRQEVFTDWAHALLDARQTDRALEVAEAGRARAIADLLAQRRVQGKAAERQILEQVRTTLDELGAARPKGGAVEVVASAEGPNTRGGGLEQQLAHLRSQNQELASLLTVDSPKIDEIKAVAARLGVAIVEYLTTDSRLVAWVVQPSGAVNSVRQDVTREALTSSIKKLRREIDEADADGLQHPERVRPLLRTLDGQLFEPLKPWLSPETPLVIVPHGPLWLVPFAALEDTHGKSLAERYSLSFVPSVSVFRYTGAKRAAAARLQRALLVADPVPPHDSGLGSLSGSREEASRIQARLGREHVDLLTGAEASEAAVKRKSGQYGILHFATHGLIAEDKPLESSLVLAEGHGEDGYLRVDEVFGLDLKADLVVLSGCSTGLGRLSGEGVLGLTRAFLYAGTRSLVVSQWDVSDRATAFVMDQFYAELEAGRPKVAALRAAQLSAKERWPHPALWAAFELVGEPR